MNDVDLFYCETHRCRLMPEACAARYRNAVGKSKSRPGMFGYRPGADDDRCRECQIGKSNAEKYGPRPKRFASPEKKETPMETKTCKHPDCQQAGKEQPIDNFQKNARTKSPDGRLDTCRACMKRLQSAGRKKEPQPKEAKAPEASKAPGPEEKASADIVQVEIRMHPDLLALVQKKAADELRTVENQIIFDLRAALNFHPQAG